MFNVLLILIDNYPNYSSSKQRYKNHQQSLNWHLMQTALLVLKARFMPGVMVTRVAGAVSTVLMLLN